MSIHMYPKNTLGNANYGWLNTHYHFSFANYYNPERMGFGTLRVINDDTAPLHIHQNTKIFAGRLTAGTTINHAITHQLYIVGISGTVTIDGQSLSVGDGAKITNQSTVTLTATTSADILLLDVP